MLFSEAEFASSALCRSGIALVGDQIDQTSNSDGVTSETRTTSYMHHGE